MNRRKWTNRLSGVIAISAAMVHPATAKTFSCAPKENTARILKAPLPSAVHAQWQGESRIGLSWSFEVKEKLRKEAGPYYKGNLISPRGGIVNRGVFIIPDEWDCGTY